jgi:hypothetical protein
MILINQLKVSKYLLFVLETKTKQFQTANRKEPSKLPFHWRGPPNGITQAIFFLGGGGVTPATTENYVA